MRLSADRLWILGGVVAAVLLLALGWTAAISPTIAEADGKRIQADDTEVRIANLHRRLGELQQQRTKLPTVRQELTTYRAALPADSGVPAFLRQLQSSGDAAGVVVTTMTVSTPELVPGSAVHALPLTVTAQGTATKLGRFVDHLQTVQPRAVLVESTNLAAGGATGDSMTITLTMKAFVAPGKEQPAAAAATD